MYIEIRYKKKIFVDICLLLQMLNGGIEFDIIYVQVYFRNMW